MDQAYRALNAMLPLTTAFPHAFSSTLLITACPYLIGYTVLATSTQVGPIMFGRIATGVGGGMTLLSTPLYLAEISPPSRRGALVVVFQLVGRPLLFSLCLLVKSPLPPSFLFPGSPFILGRRLRHPAVLCLGHCAHLSAIESRRHLLAHRSAHWHVFHAQQPLLALAKQAATGSTAGAAVLAGAALRY